jgi:hypothetical protein
MVEVAGGEADIERVLLVRDGATERRGGGDMRAYPADP